VNASSRKALAKKLSFVLFPLFIVSVILVAITFRREISWLLADRNRLRDWLIARDAWSVPVFILIQFVQVVIFVIPGEVTQIAGGYVFGTLAGAAWSLIGITLGSAFNFYVARLLGRPFIEAIAGKPRLERFERLSASTRGTTAFFLFFLIPGIPKDALCYVAGLSPLRFWVFIGVSTLGRLPGIAASALLGAAAGGGKWMIVIVVGAVSIGLFALGIGFRDRIHSWIEKRMDRGEGEGR
jgi:uncharacterized membrane protein YdjX (TVP38/TMEM64 family)